MVIYDENEKVELDDWFDEVSLKDLFNEIVIDDEFKNRLFPLKEDEYSMLKESILNEGCREAIILWNNTIVDGHNRFEICKANNINFKTRQKEFENRNEVLKWIDLNQYSRRNLDPDQMSELRGRYYNQVKQEHGGQIIGSGKNYHSVKTSEIVAKQFGVSEKTIRNDAKYAEAKTDIQRNIKTELPKLTKQDTIKIAELDPFEQEKVIEKIKQEKVNVATIVKKGEINQIKKDIEEGRFILPEGKFQVIMMDGPWPYEGEFDQEHYMGRVQTPYPRMAMEDIYNLEIPADKDCVLFFWTTQKFLKESFSIIEKYGFEYKALLVWDKQKMGIGKTLRLQCEFCLVCFKGNPLWNITNMRDIMSEPRREHSRKPDTLYNIINENLIGRKLDYFSREKREGWETFGYEKFKKISNENND
jgi:N6-adenosine-specific RNA methylase IME4